MLSAGGCLWRAGPSVPFFRLVRSFLLSSAAVGAQSTHRPMSRVPGDGQPFLVIDILGNLSWCLGAKALSLDLHDILNLRNSQQFLFFKSGDVT